MGLEILTGISLTRRSARSKYNNRLTLELLTASIGTVVKCRPDSKRMTG